MNLYGEAAVDNRDLFVRLGVSLAIGLLIGIQRGWSTRAVEPGQRASGIRTFALSGLTGGVVGILGLIMGDMLIGLAFLGFAAVFAAFEWRETAANANLSATSAVAGLLTFLLGALAAVGDMQVAVAAAIVATGLLAMRETLHAWVANLTSAEIRDGLILLAMAFLLLPLLPNRAIDPWQLLNLREVWILATLIAGMSFLGYVAVRGLGARWGIMLTAAAGGLASSTATTLSLARLARKSGATGLLVAGMLVAGAVMLLRVVAIAGVLNLGLLTLLVPPIAAALVVFAAVAVWLGDARFSPGMPDLAIRSPLDLFGALRMALMIAFVILVAGLVQLRFGEAGLYVVAAASGLGDVDAITISSARMAAPPEVAVHAILIAVAVNSCSKAVLATWIGGVKVGRRFLPPTLAAIAVGAAVHLMM